MPGKGGGQKGSRNDGFYNQVAWHRAKNRTITRWRSRGLPCAYCGKPINWAEKRGYIVDHRMNRRQYPDLALDMDNLQVVHFRCNAEKFHREEKIDESKPEIGADGFPVDSAWSEE